MIKKAGTLIFERAGLSIGSSQETEVMVHDDRFFREVLFRGSIGLGDSYINGLWDAASVDDVVFKLLKSGIYHPILAGLYDVGGVFIREIKNLQDRLGSKDVIDEHYDLDVELFFAFLDSYNQYTCGYFKQTDDLNQAQENKLELICSKLNIEKGDKILDIGGGWGGLALYITERYDAEVSLVTLSKQQAKQAEELCKRRNVTVYMTDYRDIPEIFGEGNFDKLTAIGILEHIGHKNYQQFMRMVNHALKQGGRCVFQTLYSPTNRVLSNPWVCKHIFPNHELPPRNMVELIAEQYFKTVIPFQDLSPHYVKTLVAWNERFNKAADEKIVQIKPAERRKWNFYFLACAGALRARQMRVGQFAYEK